MLTIKIHTTGSAFDTIPEYELARILRGCAKYLEAKGDFPDSGNYTTNLLDINGNRVGEMKLTGKKKVR